MDDDDIFDLVKYLVWKKNLLWFLIDFWLYEYFDIEWDSKFGKYNIFLLVI